MEPLERIIRLHNLLSSARYPIPRAILQERLECSEKTVRRNIDFLRDRLGAPLEYNQEQNGWNYRPEEANMYELPGLWLNEQEIHALLTIQQLLTNLDPELLQDEIAPFTDRIRTILEKTTGLNTEQEISQYIQLLSVGKRKRQYEHFQALTSATINKKQIHISYFGRGKNKRSERRLSPVQLLHYKENWYLSAWCHEKQAMRVFSLDKIESLKTLSEPAKVIDLTVIDSFTSASFGIFTGEASGQAILEFSEEASRWVADEIWHPEQQGKWLDSGSYQLSLPYSNPIELAGEILKHGEGIKVIAPMSLIELIKNRLRRALGQYS
ncbi:MAG: WYL domain-containing protein [Thiotrichaceae bacterium]